MIVSAVMFVMLVTNMGEDRVDFTTVNFSSLAHCELAKDEIVKQFTIEQWAASVKVRALCVGQ